MSRTEALVMARAAKLKQGPRKFECPCGVIFEAPSGTTRVYCDPCRIDRQRSVYRAKSAVRRSSGRGYQDTVTRELITITQLGERDKWTCGRCGQFVNKTIPYPDPWMPSFGHVIALSRGGLDSLDNLRLEHLTCNVKAGNR